MRGLQAPGDPQGDPQEAAGDLHVLQVLPLDTLDPPERTAAEDCFSAAFWRWSLPGTSLGSLGLYSLVKAGLLKDSKVLRAAPRLPKSLLGGLLGYYLSRLHSQMTRN